MADRNNRDKPDNAAAERAEQEAAGRAAKGAPAAIDMPGDGSGPRVLVSSEPGADLAPEKAPELAAEPAKGSGQRLVLKDGALVAEADPAAKSNISEPVPGGKYLVGGVEVDADGKPLKGAE
jgi:hypothetical protein